MYSPLKYYFSPLHGAPEQQNRSILGFFKGDLRLEDTRMIYSRGIRQNLTSLRTENKWWSKYRIWIGQRMPTDDKEVKNLDYGEALSSSIFCFVLPGDGWSGRFEDSIMHGCIPVIIQDEVDVSFESLFDVNEFSLRIAEKDIDQIPEILQSISLERIKEMQKGVKKVMRRYSYVSYGPHALLSQLIREDWISQANENTAQKNNENRSLTSEDDHVGAQDDNVMIRDQGKGSESLAEEKEKLRRRRLLAADAKKKMKLIDERIGKRVIQQRSPGTGDKIKAAVDAATAGIQDDAFETILAFLTAKMKQWDS
jgi:hypothetical protein